ncbi:MAG: threonine--tRNA ligase [Rhodospirillaceae bacterium]|jgi:threonyl-tRNA synthetase|uniref:threonine--tRNA ligase n=1 Tax=unclassified Hwanghaeella TaxID=2605944 RepID=UPI000C4996F7|nr:threonine--tRNA ligase [Rhodospirillales bacterium]MAX49090.1 threonine--tRNA ligase [Rhodospirillaceae bacterium]|tara:strand:+ start:39627 stop:41579 length:1953 start_codon:yes stop_codon:yes gene_type:complete
MVAVTLPDGSVKSYPGAITALDVATDIGPGLAKAAMLARVDGVEWDLNRPIEKDAKLELIRRQDPEALELIRHDAAHVLAMAVQELFPGTQITFGPSTEDGFYYDFHREEPFSTEDFAAIEARMQDIVDRDIPIVREVWTREQVAQFFKEKGESFKAEWVYELPEHEEISMYRQGDWIDLCRGPHLPSTGRLGKAFKLLRLAGAYWRGDANNPQLQRIYGTAWRDEKELKAHLTRIEEAEKRDHRKLGRELDLFHLQEEARGSIFWHPKGWAVYRACERYMRARLEAADYVEVKTPQLVDRVLWEKSGHWEKFREHMFIAEVDEVDHDSDTGQNRRMLALKPMNCPGHVQIFKQGIKSYRELPLRMAEFGSCHRYEPSGALHGIMRVRAFTQDDAHIFCTEDQIESETREFIDLLSSIYRDFGFEEFTIKFSDRPEVRAGSDETWDKAEAALKSATEAAGATYTLNPGEGAFYGPKLEFVLRDAIGRDWQCGTLQVDFVLPERLDATYMAEDGNRYRPVMLHRAILGSFERFIGILIEQYSGKFPIWLAPVQVSVATITNDADDYAQSVLAKLKAAGLRAQADTRNEKINLKIRELSMQKIPAVLVVGKREQEEGTVALRRLGGKDQEILALDEAIHILEEEARMPTGAA